MKPVAPVTRNLPRERSEDMQHRLINSKHDPASVQALELVQSPGEIRCQSVDQRWFPCGIFSNGRRLKQGDYFRQVIEPECFRHERAGRLESVRQSLDLIRIRAENLSLGKTLALTPPLSPVSVACCQRPAGRGLVVRRIGGWLWRSVRSPPFLPAGCRQHAKHVLSPRRGRAVVRLFTLCPSRLQSAPSCVLFLKQYDHPTRSYRQHAGERFTLSWGERAGVRASVPLTFLSLLHSNTSRNPTGLTHFALTLK